MVNPGLWGKRLAEYLVDKLSARGIRTGDISAEDWGWRIPVEIRGVNADVCCGHQNGDDDQFCCFTDPRTPVFKRLFRRVDVTEQLVRITEALEAILSSDPDIREVTWTEPG